MYGLRAQLDSHAFAALRLALEGCDTLQVLSSPADIILGTRTLVQPDLFVIRQLAGVAEYWIVDLDARIVERWRPDDARPEVLSEELLWEPAPGVAARIDLPRLFVAVLGEG